MKRTLLILAAALSLAACGGNTTKKAATAQAETADMHTAENSLDVAGVYKGTFPAADCPGIEVTLTLNADGTYTEHGSYIDRNTTYDERGGYSVSGNMLTLTPLGGERGIYYKVEENRLRALDADKQVIEGPIADSFLLTKTVQ